MSDIPKPAPEVKAKPKAEKPPAIEEPIKHCQGVTSPLEEAGSFMNCEL